MPYGPCIMCGATNYPNSLGGPNICPPCDCGISPEVTKLRRQLDEANWKIIKLEIENSQLRKELDKK